MHRYEQSTPTDALAAEPHSPRDQPPISQREEKSLQEVEFVTWLLLVLVEGLVDHAVVLELSQHQLHSPHEERTTRVAEIIARQGRCGRILADC